jgi:hypothetical protein
MARRVLDKFWYWLAWSTLFALLMPWLTSALGSDRVVVVVCSFFAFWGRTLRWVTFESECSSALPATSPKANNIGTSYLK